MTTINQFQILRLKLHMVFTQKLEFWFFILFYSTFEKLNLSTFWGPSLNGFAKFDKINQFPLLSNKDLTDIEWKYLTDIEW